jgi:hypothetical protein
MTGFAGSVGLDFVPFQGSCLVVDDFFVAGVGLVFFCCKGSIGFFCG